MKKSVTIKGKTLKQIYLESGEPSQASFGVKYLGLAQNSANTQMSRYCNDVDEIPWQCIENLCKNYGMTITELFKRNGTPDALIGGNTTEPIEIPRKRIPILEWAQIGGFMSNALNMSDFCEFVDLTGCDGRFFAVKVSDNAMSPRFLEGELLIVQVVPRAKSGQIVVVQIDNQPPIFRHLSVTKQETVLTAINPNVSAISVSKKDASARMNIIGVVVEVRRTLV